MVWCYTGKDILKWRWTVSKYTPFKSVHLPHRYIHPCEICGRIFNSIGNLERHKIIHTGGLLCKCLCVSGAFQLCIEEFLWKIEMFYTSCSRGGAITGGLSKAKRPKLDIKLNCVSLTTATPVRGDLWHKVSPHWSLKTCGGLKVVFFLSLMHPVKY